MPPSPVAIRILTFVSHRHFVHARNTAEQLDSFSANLAPFSTLLACASTLQTGKTPKTSILISAELRSQYRNLFLHDEFHYYPLISFFVSQVGLFQVRVISGFRRAVEENWALLGYNAASSGNSLTTFRDNLSVLYSGVNS